MSVGDVTDSLFSVDETGANAGDIRILSAADREAISSYIISVRVGITCLLMHWLPVCVHKEGDCVQ